jgi:hypothetical protein
MNAIDGEYSRNVRLDHSRSAAVYRMLEAMVVGFDEAIIAGAFRPC